MAASTDHDPVLANEALEEALSERPLAWDLMRDVEVNIWPRFVERFRLDLNAFLLAEERQSDGVVTWMPDLVYAYEEALEIVDWKTFFVGMTENEAFEAFQSRFYLWQAMHVWPNFPAYRIRYVFPRLGYDTVATLTPQDLAAFGDRVHSLIEQIQSARARNYWPAIPGDHCKYCTLACELADDSRRAPLRVVTSADAEAALLRAVALQRQVDHLREALRGYCEVNGSVTVNGVAAQHKPVESRRWNLVDVLEVLREFGITDLTTLPKMEVAATTLQPLLKTKKRADIGVSLRARAVVRHGQYFEISKPMDPAMQPQEATETVSA